VLAIYSEDARYVARIKAALGGSAPVVSTNGWEQFEQAFTRAACSIAVVEWLRSSSVFPRLTSLKARFRLQPMVLVTSKDADNARALQGLAVEEVVWLSEIQDALSPAVRRANAGALLQRVGLAIKQAGRLPAALRECLVHACGSDGPVHSVAELAAALGRDRRTLWRHWHGAVAKRVGLRLEDVVDWLLLLHAVGRKVPSRSWSNIAAELHVHQHTLARAATRLAGRSLRALAATDQLTLARQFDAAVLGPLVGARTRTFCDEPRHFGLATPSR